MDRDLMSQLDVWKDSARRKPLILHGARQVGKTWLLKEFGATCFENVCYINFDGNPVMSSSFDVDYDVDRLVADMQIASKETITEGKTLVILDEIQECPKALTSLKYFRENKPGLHVAAAGSLLGLTIHQGTGFPVGNVNTLNLYPLTFREFLDATGNGALRTVIDDGDGQRLNTFAPQLVSLLKSYYYVGGMPEVVSTYLDGGIFSDVRAAQQVILDNYRLDASKHLGGLETERVLAVWDSIPSHLSKENKRFVFGQIREGARARSYREAITWLVQAGLATRVRRVSKPDIPLSAYAEESAFKLFMLDIGLLGAMADLDETSVLSGSRVFEEFKGALTEQYVCQQLVGDCGLVPYYWSAENSRGEIDFLIQERGGAYPLEVKAEENLRAKSLRAFSEKYPSAIPRRFSLSGYRDEDWMRNVPLFAVGNKSCWTV